MRIIFPGPKTMTIKVSDVTRFQLSSSTQEQGVSLTMWQTLLQRPFEGSSLRADGFRAYFLDDMHGMHLLRHLLHFNAIRYPVADMAINGRAWPQC
tara:strand:+ start:17611 stop:17898 length:288 start_codon:yes stop_codon:yes gene_type:complete